MIGITVAFLVVVFWLTLSLVRALRHTPKPDALGRKPLQTQDPVFAALTDPKGSHCPDCGNDTFYYGPHGGACQNVMCTNDLCGSRFNLAPFDDGWCGAPFMADRISEPMPKANLKVGVSNDTYKSHS